MPNRVRQRQDPQHRQATAVVRIAPTRQKSEAVYLGKTTVPQDVDPQTGEHDNGPIANRPAVHSANLQLKKVSKNSPAEAICRRSNKKRPEGQG